MSINMSMSSLDTSKKYFIKNNSNSKLLLQNSKKEVFCKLGAKQTSFETFDYEELRNNAFIQVLLSKGIITLTVDRVEEPKPIYNNYGQKYLVGTRCELVGKHHLIIIIEQYLPSTGQYKARLEISGGLMTLSEREIQPLTDEAVKLAEAKKKQNNVDVVVNSTDGEARPKVKNVKDIMNEAQNELNNTDYEMPQIITVNNNEQTQTSVEVDNTQDEQEVLRQQFEAEQLKQQTKVLNTQNTVTPIAQAPDDNEVEDNIYIVKPNKGLNQKFASEVTQQKIIKDTVEATQNTMREFVEDINVNVKPNVSDDKKDINTIMKNISQQYQAWFVTFLNKDERKKKQTIAVCRDKDKLNLIINNCGEYEKSLAIQRLNNLK